MVSRLPVPSRVEVASAGLSSAVPRLDSRGRAAPRRARGEAPEGAGAEIGFVSVAQVKAGDAVFGGPELVLIAGPCVIESYESCIRHATRLAEIARRAGLPLVFKSSFDKANRTSHGSFRGPGLNAGLRDPGAGKARGGRGRADRHPRTVAGGGGGAGRRRDSDSRAALAPDRSDRRGREDRMCCEHQEGAVPRAVGYEGGGREGRERRDPANYFNRARVFVRLQQSRLRHALAGDNARASATRSSSMRPTRRSFRAPERAANARAVSANSWRRLRARRPRRESTGFSWKCTRTPTAPSATVPIHIGSTTCPRCSTRSSESITCLASPADSHQRCYGEVTPAAARK